MTKEFMRRRISKEVINLGIGGQIERGGEELPPRSTVKFQAQATVSSVKFKFIEDGTVEELTILTVDPESFAVLAVKPATEQQELPLDRSTPAEIAEADALVARMNLRGSDNGESGPLLTSCEACGHERTLHHEPTTEVPGACTVCPCVTFVPFVAVPEEGALEPVPSEPVEAK